jgi:hypothetical protein
METSINERIKTLFREKTMASLHRYQSGKIYYRYEVEEGMFEFPIDVVEESFTYEDDGSKNYFTGLSEDLGDTAFNMNVRASELTRWIKKAALISKLKKL